MRGTRLKSQLYQTGIIFRSFGGNAKACILAEFLWSIPFNMYITYTSVYMVALGCTEKQIGLIASITLVFQMFFSLMGGYVTDKLGRKRTSLIFDLISWSIPAFIMAIAQNFYYFLVASIIQSVVRIVHTSWRCLIVEDTPSEDRVHVFTWIQVAGIISGFVTPIAGFLVGKFQLVPAVRGFYFFAFIVMTLTFFLRNHMVRETELGLKRMKETENENFFSSIRDYKDAINQLITTPYTMIAFMLSVFTNIHSIIRTNFFAIMLTDKLGFSEGSIAVFPTIQSGVMLVVFLFVMPTLGRLNFKMPLLSAFLSLIGSNLLLVISPSQNYAVVIVSTALMAYGTAVSFPFIESILANSIEDSKRAKIMSILYVILFAITAPFGYIGGFLASISQELPFVLATLIFIVCIFLILALVRLEKLKS